MITPDDIRRIVGSPERRRETPLDRLVVKSLKGSVAIWDDPDVLNFYNNKAMKWEPRQDTAVFIPCSAWKPYFYSQSHKDGYLKALLPCIDEIDLFVVSEPMTIVPYCYSDEYPATSYEYDPYKFFIGKTANQYARESLSIFVNRLGTWLSKNHNRYSKRILILPKSWHLKVFRKSLNACRIPADKYITVSMNARAFQAVDDIKRQISVILPR